jgi:hypothetical protein
VPAATWSCSSLGPQTTPSPHLRFRRATVQWWYLEMPSHTGHLERTPYRGSMDELLHIVQQQFGWTLEPLDPP